MERKHGFMTAVPEELALSCRVTLKLKVVWELPGAWGGRIISPAMALWPVSALKKLRPGPSEHKDCWGEQTRATREIHALRAWL